MHMNWNKRVKKQSKKFNCLISITDCCQCLVVFKLPQFTFVYFTKKSTFKATYVETQYINLLLPFLFVPTADKLSTVGAETHLLKTFIDCFVS